MPGSAPAPPPSAPPASGANMGNAGSPVQMQGGYGVPSAETPMPGREKEYEAYQQQVGAMGAAGPAPEIPPIDADRRNRAPGLQNNFYDRSTADFKRPHGMPQSASAPPPSAPPASGMPGSNAGPATRVGFGAPSAETPMPGREKEYQAYQQQVGAYQEQVGAAGAGAAAPAPPPIDADRRNRSP